MNPIVAAAKSLTRLLAFIGRELAEVARRPGALALLMFGPFLVMAVFGLGYSGFKQPLATLLVIPAGSGLPTDVETYRRITGPGFEIAGITGDAAAADAELRAGSVDVVVIAPPDARQQFEGGRQAQIEVRIDRSDPTQAAYAQSLADQLSSAVNREIIRTAAQEGEDQAARNNVPGATRIPPEVIAAPTRANVVNLAPTLPSVVGYFGPAVLALVLQHMAVTLIALSVVRERTTGVIELFRLAPVSAWEIVAGKILGFGFLCAAIAIASSLLLVGGLGVPLLGSPGVLAAVVALLVIASLGIGLFISIVAVSESQAVQLSLLVLLASVFFSGFVLPVSEFSAPVRVAAFAIPVTSGIELVQDVMLRGEVRDAWQVGVLAAIALIVMLACWLSMRRGMTRA